MRDRNLLRCIWRDRKFLFCKYHDRILLSCKFSAHLIYKFFEVLKINKENKLSLNNSKCGKNLWPTEDTAYNECKTKHLFLIKKI